MKAKLQAGLIHSTLPNGEHIATLELHEIEPQKIQQCFARIEVDGHVYSVYLEIWDGEVLYQVFHQTEEDSEGQLLASDTLKTLHEEE